MADGSLRIEVEVEPGDAQKAFALFGMPGAPMALAALVVGHAAVKEPALKGGPLAKAAGMLDTNADFIEWCDDVKPRAFILEYCEVSSRRELDHNNAAKERFHNMMMMFNQWHRLAYGKKSFEAGVMAEKNKCRYPDCVDNVPDKTCQRWLTGDCSGRKVAA